jgi:hypothetical protein
MSKRTVPLTIAPLQRIVAIEITDPAEQAAIDKMRKRVRGKLNGQKTTVSRKSPRSASRSSSAKKKR